MAYKAVIFDLSHTLVVGFSRSDFDNLFREMADILSLSVEALRTGWSATSSERILGILRTIEANISHICDSLAVSVDEGQIRAAADKRIALTQRSLQPRPDAVATLSQLRKGGLRIGLISDCSPDVPPLWEASELARLVDEAILSCEVALRKPDPRIYLLACDRLSVSPQDCLYVGDGGSHELTGAARVGMSPVRIMVPFEDVNEYPRGEVDEWDGPTISALSELRHLIFRHEK